MLMNRTSLIALALACATPLFAQTPTTETLIRGPIDDGFVAAPDFKLTEVNGEFATLAGGYGGWVVNRKLLLGGGIFTMATGPSADSMTYGGAVVEYFVNQGSLVNLSFRGLVGGGSATLGTSFASRPYDGPGPGRGPFDDGMFHRRFPGVDISSREVERSSDFLVAEPELDLMLNVSERIRLSFGGGYRFIGGASGLDERLDGFTASAALKLAFF
jgi:hypothetical protein